jgi:hypothetical protein
LILGGHRGNDQEVATQEATGPNAQPLYNERYTAERCNLYQKEFMKCLDQAGGDSSQCQGFWEALKVGRFSKEFFFKLFFSLKECKHFQGANGMSLNSI